MKHGVTPLQTEEMPTVMVTSLTEKTTGALIADPNARTTTIGENAPLVPVLIPMEEAKAETEDNAFTRIVRTAAEKKATTIRAASDRMAATVPIVPDSIRTPPTEETTVRNVLTETTVLTAITPILAVTVPIVRVSILTRVKRLRANLTVRVVPVSMRIRKVAAETTISGATVMGTTVMETIRITAARSVARPITIPMTSTARRNSLSIKNNLSIPTNPSV